jgi:hypothetical protein
MCWPSLGGPAGRNAREAGEQVGDRHVEPLVRADGAPDVGGRGGEPGRHQPGDVLVRLVLEESREEQVALLEQRLQRVVVAVGAGEQLDRLELDQRGRDQEELGGDLEVEAAHSLHLGEIVLGDAGDRDLPQVDLLPRDEVQQQVERALELRGPDDVVHRRTACVDGPGPGGEAVLIGRRPWTATPEPGARRPPTPAAPRADHATVRPEGPDDPAGRRGWYRDMLGISRCPPTGG